MLSPNKEPLIIEYEWVSDWWLKNSNVIFTTKSYTISHLNHLELDQIHLLQPLTLDQREGIS